MVPSQPQVAAPSPLPPRCGGVLGVTCPEDGRGGSGSQESGVAQEGAPALLVWAEIGVVDRKVQCRVERLWVAVVVLPVGVVVESVAVVVEHGGPSGDTGAPRPHRVHIAPKDAPRRGQQMNSS